MMTLSLAVRNLRRNRRRTIATLAAIAIGAASVLLFGGYSVDIEYALQTAYVRRGGHLQIQHRDYYLFGSGDPAAYGIARYRDIIEAIKADEILRELALVVTPTLQFGGVAGNYAAGVTRTVLGNGLVAADQDRIRAWNHYRIDQVNPPLGLAGTQANGAVVGVGLARVLLMCDALHISDCPKPQEARPNGGAAIPEDIARLSFAEGASSGKVASASNGLGSRRIELLASSARGTPNVASLEVIQAENQGFKELDEISLFIHLQQAQRLVYGAATPKATSIVVQLRDTADIPVAMARLETKLPSWAGDQSLVLRDFASLNPFYVQSMQLFNTIFAFMFILIGAIVTFTVSNTMNTAIVERTVEIGTLRAMGLRQSGIRRLFVTEGVVLGIAGALSGVALALGVAFIINHMGIRWRPPGTEGTFPLALRVWGEARLIAGTSVALVVFTSVSAWWPAFRAARLRMVDALRHT